jgi:serine/threonine-protein kinase
LWLKNARQLLSLSAIQQTRKICEASYISSLCPINMKMNKLLACAILLTATTNLLAQFTITTASATSYHPRDQIALQLGAIQMGYTVPFQLVSGNATNAQRAANALIMGRNALDATVKKPAVKVQGFVKSPAVNTVDFRDQLYQAVEAVVTSPVSGSIRGNVSIVGATRPLAVSSTLSIPPNTYTIPVPYAVEAGTSVDTQILTEKLMLIGVLPQPGEGIVSTLAGSSIGNEDGSGIFSSFNCPYSLAVDVNGNVYVADRDNESIRKIAPSGTVTTLAGAGFRGYADGNGASASFTIPSGVAVDASGNVYVADSGNHRIRKITSGGIVTTLAGSGFQGSANGNGVSASFAYPASVAVDASGNVYVADQWSHLIRKISPSGTVTTLAGSGGSGYADGDGASASFAYPSGVAVDASGNVYVADSGNNRIRKITSAGVVTTFAGAGVRGSADGNGASARFNYPTGVAVDASGNVYVAEVGNHRIRKITSGGMVTTLAGSGDPGFADRNGRMASFYNPLGVTVDGSGNVYVADSGNHKIRKITISE